MLLLNQPRCSLARDLRPWWSRMDSRWRMRDCWECVVTKQNGLCVLRYPAKVQRKNRFVEARI